MDLGGLVNTILEQDAPLYVDVACGVCGKRCALSNTVERAGRRVCWGCEWLVTPWPLPARQQLDEFSLPATGTA